MPQRGTAHLEFAVPLWDSPKKAKENSTYNAHITFTCGTTMSPPGPLSAPATGYIRNRFSHKQLLLSLGAESH